MSNDTILDLLTQEETAALFQACLEYITIDKVEVALRRGLTELERRQLAYQLSIEFDLEESGFRSP